MCRGVRRARCQIRGSSHVKENTVDIPQLQVLEAPLGALVPALSEPPRFDTAPASEDLPLVVDCIAAEVVAARAPAVGRLDPSQMQDMGKTMVVPQLQIKEDIVKIPE